MSLKTIHIVFILSSIALALGFGCWGVLDYKRSASLLNLALGAGSFAAAAGLVFYLGWFIRKARNLVKK